MPEPEPNPRPRRRRLRRIVWTVLLVLVALPVLIVLGTLAALRAAGVRQAILARISSLLADEYGLAVTARDFSPLWLRRGVELRDVRLGAPGAAPVATAVRVRAEIELGSLRRRPLVVRSLVADGLRIDLAAPFPKTPEPAAEPGARPPVEILRIVLRNGEVKGAPVSMPAAEWVRSWNLRDIEAQGRYRGGRMTLEVRRGDAVLDRPRMGPQALRFAGGVEYEERKPLLLRGLRVTGDGLRLAASASVGLEKGSPTAARFDLYAEPRILLPGVPARGFLRAAGRIALPEVSGQLKLTAEEIPAEVLKPYLDGKLYADLSLAGTAADLDTDMVLGPRDWGQLAGTAQAVWRRGVRRLVRAEAHLTPEPTALVAARVAAELLPGSPGRRSLEGRIRAASWTDLARVAADGLRAEVRLPDVRAALAEARSVWPRLVPAPPEGVPLQGSLTADARLSGLLSAPDAVVDATWLPRAGSRVHVEAKGKPRSWTGAATVRTEGLPLELFAALLPDLAGSVSGTAELSGSPRGYRTRVEAELAGLTLPPALQKVEGARLTADGMVVLRPLSYRGSLSLGGTGLVALPNGAETARLGSFQVDGDGLLRASPLRWDGRLAVSGVDGEAAGAGRVDRFEAVADGALTGRPLAYEGTLTLDGTGVERPGAARVDHLRLAAEGKGGADLQALAATARVDADRIALVEPPTDIRDLHLEATGAGREVRLSALSGELPEGRTLQASGRFVTDPLLAEADLDVHLVKPIDAVTAADIMARLRDGILEVSSSRLDTVSGPGRLRARIPLAALHDVPQLAAALDSLPVKKAPGPVSFSLTFPELDSEPLLAVLGLEPRPERVRTGLAAELVLALTEPAAGRGEVRLSGLTVETPDGRVTAEGPAVLRLADGRLDLAPVHLRIDGGAVQGAGIDLRASAELRRSWRPFEDPVSAAVTRVAGEGSGTLDAALLNPYLAGGAAEGSLAFSATASGPSDRLEAEVKASGQGASFVWPAAALQVEDPRLALDLRDGRWTIREGRLGVNGGTVELAGGYSSGKGLGLEAQLAGVHYRLDFGIDTVLSGQLAFQAPPESPMRLSGSVVVDRGVLDRSLNLDREVFTLLFKPPEAPGTGESALAAVALDLAVETVEGVRIKNNVGNLHASWRRLDVGGTLESPVIRGRIDIDPGGRFFAYGQTVRIDRGSLLFTGDPVNDPQLDLETTTSVQDPTIARLEGGGPLDLLVAQQAERTDTEGREDTKEGTKGTDDLLSAGLAGYYGARFAGRLGESVGLGGFSVRPEVIFRKKTGEEVDPKNGDTERGDPTARLTVTGDLSSSVAVALSVDLRNAERQSYFVYLQELRSLPGLRIKAFTNDAGHKGASLQQELHLGGVEARKEERGPRLRRIEVSTPKKGVPKRAIRRALGLKKRQPVPAGAAFAVELDVADLLRSKRYPGPRIAVAVKPVESRPGWVDLAVTVEPGPRVSFVFAGDRPPRTLRPEITRLYRTDFYEASSIEEMRQAVVRVFRSSGYVDPQVEIAVREETPGDPAGRRTVTLRTEAGRRQSLNELEIAGLDPEDAQLVAGAFPGTLARAELAAGQPHADSRLLGVLRALAYPEAKIAARSVGAGGSRLVVTVEPGPRQTLSGVEVRGVEEPERGRLRGLLTLRPGDPVRLDRVSRSARDLELDLQQRGFAAAAVRSSVVPVPGHPNAPEAVYDVTLGPHFRLAGVEVAGERWSRRGLLLRETGLAAGEPFVEADVEEARNRLFRTGLFSRVDTDVEKKATGDVHVSFSLAERSRFRLGYGVRWESAAGTSAVLDLEDQNFLGRAMILGLLGLYQPQDRSARLYLRTGGVLGTGISLESFAEQRRLVSPDDDNLIEDRRELSLQASRPLGEALKARLYARHRTTHLFEMEPDPFFPLDLEIRVPLLGAQLQRDTRDDPIDPSRGLFASVDLSGSGAFLGSDFALARLFAQMASFRDVALAGRPLIWAQSAKIGLAHPFAGQEIIRSERFFAGGPYSVRGYEMEGLGPREILGSINRAAGGGALLVVNQELRLSLPWDLTGLVFFDAGQIWARPGDADFDLAKSLGIGLRARTPLGLLRLDAAYPLDRRAGEDRYRLYVGFGNAF